MKTRRNGEDDFVMPEEDYEFCTYNSVKWTTTDGEIHWTVQIIRTDYQAWNTAK